MSTTEESGAVVTDGTMNYLSGRNLIAGSESPEWEIMDSDYPPVVGFARADFSVVRQ